MKATLIFLLLLASTLCLGQGKIEIYVNGELQKISVEPIRVRNINDRIEIRITPSGLKQRNDLIDSIKTEGCGTEVYKPGKGKILEPKVLKNLQSSINSEVRKDAVNRRFKPVFNENHLSFSCTLNQITACKGKFFFLELTFDPKKSDVNTYKNYMDKYKFYYVL